MELILKETISTLGREGDIVKVKDGYGRNYLLPQGKAVLATPGNLANLKQNKAAIQARLDKENTQAEHLAKKISGLDIIIEQLAGVDERLFGSVTSNDIAAKLADLGCKVDKKNILLSDPIKTLGQSKVQVKTGYNVFAEITVNVVPLSSKEKA